MALDIKYKIIAVLFFTGAIFMLLITAHESTHKRQYEILGCDNITQNVFSVTADCYSEEVNYITADLEKQYLHIWGYTIISLLLLINIIKKY